MKKSVCILLIFALLFSMSFAVAQENITSAQAQIDKAYDCLDAKVSGNCGTIAPQERIFALLASGQCRDEVIADSLNGECWPGSKCDLKQTAQAILALSNIASDTTESEEWLMSQNTSPEDVEWYLQIESGKETRCTITYDGTPHIVVLKEDKTLTTGAKPCLSLSSGDWWLKVAPGCYDREFKISCDEGFQTNLLFKRKTSSVIHVSENTHSASALGTTTEEIKSLCFMQGGKCNYEGSLWATLVLESKGYDTTAFLPYLTTTAEENSEYLPESFLYILTGQEDYRNNLLLRQRSNKFWDEAESKFYDTAVALYSISDEPPEKVNAKEWLLEVQDSEGCWQGNIRDTAFVLASVWPRSIGTITYDCESAGNYCMAEVSCDGNILSSYSCPGVSKCCDSPIVYQPCADQGGTICNSQEQCLGYTTTASDANAGETCCLGGTCEIVKAGSECIDFGGLCRATGCGAGEEESAYQCDYGDTCCVQATGSTERSYWWIWLLAILIVLVVLGIIFRNKLRPYYYKIISKFKRRPSGGAAISRPPTGRPGMPMRRYTPRKILPPSARSAPVRRPPAKKPGELGNVLNRLKEMSK